MEEVAYTSLFRGLTVRVPTCTYHTYYEQLRRPFRLAQLSVVGSFTCGKFGSSRVFALNRNFRHLSKIMGLGQALITSGQRAVTRVLERKQSQAEQRPGSRSEVWR